MSLSGKQKKEVGKLCVADEIFGKGFYFRIPYQASIPPTELKLFGLTGFYEKEELAQELNNPIVVKSTIAQIAMIIQDGYEVSLVYENEAKQIFEYIVQHLKNWKQVIQQFPNVCSPPFEDLLLLDSMAGLIYPFVPKEEDANDLKNTNLLSGAILGLNFLNPNFGKISEPVVKHYESFAPFFIEKLYEFEEPNRGPF